MKKILFSIFAAVIAIGFVGCEYDDSELVGRVDNLEQRVLTLEQLCQQMNTNISSLQSLVSALQNQDYITSVTPIKQGNDVIGYTITFAKGEPITIYHGQDGKNGADGEDGKDGYTPVIGVDQDEDGVYYWTLDGEWLTDADGNKIPTSGKDGADGEDGEGGKAGMPELRIQGGYWYVSYDGGENWERLGRATGYDGSDGDAFFKSVDTTNPDYVKFTMSDGKTFIVPKYGFAVEFVDVPDQLTITVGGEALSLSYNISGCQNPIISVSSDLNAVIDEDNKTIKISAPQGKTYDITERVTLSVSNGNTTIMDVVDVGVVYDVNITSADDLLDLLANPVVGEIDFDSEIDTDGDAIEIKQGSNVILNMNGKKAIAGSATNYSVIGREDTNTVINNANIHSKGGGIGAADGAKVVFNGGTVYVDTASTSGRYIFYAEGAGTTITINDGNFSWDPSDNQKRAYIYAGAGTYVYVNGGTFGKASTRSGYTDGILGSGTVIITGGTFGFDPSKWVADGYEAVKSGETWTVSKK